jgi:multidrug transporter EmrE-like cation transporter
VAEARPAIYLYAQTYRVEGREVTRAGFIALGEVSEYARGVVLPHERTHAGPKADRLRLLEVRDSSPSPSSCSACCSTPRRTPILAGLAGYVVSVVVWILALSRVPVSIAYPMLSVGYIVNALAASELFSESLTAQKLVGIGFIIVGVWLVARS